MELEKQNKQLKESSICERCGGGIAGSLSMANKVGGIGDGLPKEPEKCILKGHQRSITKVIIHPIYTMVATSSEDGLIKLWDYDSGDCDRSLRGHTGKVSYVAFHPNGKILASCGTDMTIKLWNVDQEY